MTASTTGFERTTETDMPTDDERREVARMLRELPGDSTYPDLIGVIADRDGWYPAADAADRLADLIDPGESGQNLDKNRDTVQIESPAVQKAPECDRDALLALADECDSVHMHKVARRIREACGEE